MDKSRKNQSEVKYSNIDSKTEIRLFKTIDDKTGITIKTDTVPRYIPYVIRDSKRKIDTTIILFKTARVALKYGLMLLGKKTGKDDFNMDSTSNIGLIDRRYWLINGTMKHGTFGGYSEIIFSKYDGRIVYFAQDK